MTDVPELWTVAQAAAYWGVSESRARALLASRGIQRITGYPADLIMAVERRQGARTDLPVPPPKTNDEEPEKSAP